MYLCDAKYYCYREIGTLPNCEYDGAFQEDDGLYAECIEIYAKCDDELMTRTLCYQYRGCVTMKRMRQ